MPRSDTIFHRMSDGSAGRLSWAGLTPDLLERARGRVKVLGWLMLAFTGLGATIDLLYVALVLGRLDTVWVVASAVTVALSAGLIVAAGDRRVSHRTVLQLALAYEVVLCFVLAVLMPWFAYADVGDVPYVTWVTPLIILFPLIVPSPPRITLLTAVAAAATRPLALLLLSSVAGLEIQPNRYLVSSLSPAFAVALAYVGSRVVYGMNVDLAQARRMGSYQLETRLGAGGMGEVWRARHQLLARPAAVKFIRPETVAREPESQRVMLARFEREAQVTAALCSPHTIQLYDFGVAQGGTFYYVMELLSGLDLDALVTRFGPLSPARTVHLLRQVCDSLGEAHANGLIHRDVKPANVYACRYGRRVDFVKVLDFGLVKFRQDYEETHLDLTTDQTVGGTPAFMAPEQVLGGEADGRTDIYALGCVAYWLLTGTHVFTGHTVMHTLMMHTQATPSAPSAVVEQAIPEALDRIVLSCLEKAPDRRPPDVDRLAAQLAACDVGEPWTEQRANQWWEKHLPDR